MQVNKSINILLNNIKMNKHFIKEIIFFIFLILIYYSGFSQKINQQDSSMIKQVFNASLNEGQSYLWLDYLSNNIGSRLSGSL